MSKRTVNLCLFALAILCWINGSAALGALSNLDFTAAAWGIFGMAASFGGVFFIATRDARP